MAAALPPVIKPLSIVAVEKFADAGLKAVQRNAGLKGVGAWWVFSGCRPISNSNDREGTCGFGFVFSYGAVCGGLIDVKRVPKQPKLIEYKFRQVNCK